MYIVIVCIFEGANPLLVAFGKYFFRFHRLSFHSVDGFLDCAKHLKFNKVSFVLLLLFCFGVASKKILIYVNCSAYILFHSTFSFMASGLRFRSLNHVYLLLHIV